MKCYKVVGRYKDHYVSCRTSDEYELSYRIKEWATAWPGTIGLCTFDTIEHARAFIRQTGRFDSDIIFLAEGKGKRHSRFICWTNTLTSFYKRKKSKQASDGILPPDGTLFFDQVMLLKEIV